MKKTNILGHSRGFTLIELLVVIAIIGILASVVLASLNSARDKGNNAAIKSSLSGIRSQAEIQYDGNNCYTSVAGDCVSAADAVSTCAVANLEAESIFRQTQISQAITAAGNAYQGGTGLASGNCAQAANGGVWAVAVQLKAAEGANTHWCVDSTGASRATAATISTTNCP